MEPFSSWILPLLLTAAALWGCRRRVDVYDALVCGGKNGLHVAVSILPALAALLTALGVPPETAPLLVIRPLSGSGALAAGSDLMRQYGTDSYIGRCAAVMLGCTETTFYTVAVYFGAAGIRKTRYTVPAALTADAAAFLSAAFAVRLFFGQ